MAFYTIQKNKDKDFFNEISKKVSENDGYCPCMIDRNEDTKCICKEFKEQKTGGYCHCKRYYKKIIK